MPSLGLVRWEIRRTAAGRAPGRTCPRCGSRGDWSVVHERQRMRVLGAGVGRARGRALVACHGCGCALPAGWREAQREPSATPVPA